MTPRTLSRTAGALAALALLAACGDAGGDVQSADTTGADAAEDRPLTLDLGGEHVDVAVTFPPEAAGEPALYDRLRAQAEAEAEEAREVAAEDADFAAQNDFPFNRHSLEITWETRFASETALSLLRTTFVFQGGAHPNTYFNAANWLVQEDRAFGIGELVAGQDGFDALSTAAREAIMAEKRARLGDGLSDADYWGDQVREATAPAAGNFEPFTLIPARDAADHIGGITLHYSPYELGPYVEGAYHVDIPQAVFAGHASPPFAAMLGGAP